MSRLHPVDPFFSPSPVLTPDEVVRQRQAYDQAAGIPRPAHRPAARPPGRPPGRVAVPRHSHPGVVAVWQAMRDQGVTVAALAKATGVSHSTVIRWRAARVLPGGSHFEAALAVLGLRLAVVPRDA